MAGARAACSEDSCFESRFRGKLSWGLCGLLQSSQEIMFIYASLFTYDLHKDAANILDFVASNDIWLVTNE
jgi:hypothetical protein